MSQADETPAGNAADRNQRAIVLQQQIDDRTQRLVALYDSWNRVAERRTELTSERVRVGPDEDLRKGLEAIDRQDGEIGRQIEDLDSELDVLYDALRECQGDAAEREGKQTDDADRLQLEQTKLHRRLHRVADAQTAAVRRWNRRPAEERREAFEQEMRALHAEFTEVLRKLKELRANESPKA